MTEKEKLEKKKEGLSKAIQNQNTVLEEKKAALLTAEKSGKKDAIEKATNDVAAASTKLEKLTSDLTALENAPPEPEQTAPSKVSLTLRHTTKSLFYFRCGLRLTKNFEGYNVPEEDVLRLLADPWIEQKA